MKIANQLLSTSPSTGIKAGASLDNGAEFHGALTAATAAAIGADSKDTPQIKAKPQTPVSKSETSETKKKSLVPEPANADVPATEIAPLKQALPSAAYQFPNSLPLTNEALTSSTNRALNGSRSSAELTGEGVSFSSSLASISPVVQSATDMSTTAWTGKQVVDGKPTTSASSVKTPELSVIDGTDQPVSSAVSSSSELGATQVATARRSGDLPSATAAAAVPVAPTSPNATGATVSPNVPFALRALIVSVLPNAVAVPAAPDVPHTAAASIAPVAPPAAASLIPPAPVGAAMTGPALPSEVSAIVATAPVAVAPVTSAVTASQAVAAKAATDDQASKVSKPTDTSTSNATVTASDSMSPATQPTATVVAQSVASLPLPGASFAGEFQSGSASATSQAQLAGSGTNAIKSDASRQTTSSAKAKPASDSSAPGSRFADGTGNNTQTDGASAATVSSVVKVPEASAAGNQGASEAKNVLDIANLQQAPAVSQTSGANHTSQASQTVSTSAGTTAQTVPAQAVPDSQPMQGVNSAQLIQSMRSSEMKLGMQSAEFGNISISTSLNHQTLSAQISIDHSELGRALAVHLPAIEEKLGSAYGVQARVELRDSNNPSSSSDSGYSNSGQQSREQRQSQGGGSAVSQSASFEGVAPRASFTPVSMTASVSRLDIRV